MTFEIHPFVPTDPAKLPTRVQSSQHYLADAVDLIHAGNDEAAIRKIQYVRERMLPLIEDQLKRSSRRHAI
jgi:hypothetical protein